MGRFRLGLTLGLVAGYILGTRAGRERYVQIERGFRQAARLAEKVRSSGVTKMVAQKAGEALENGLEKGKNATASKMPWAKDRLGDQQPASSF